MRCGFNVINRILYLSTERGLKRRNLTDLKFAQLFKDEKVF